MVSYLLRRLLIGLVTLAMITCMIYGLIRSMPGSPLDADPAMMDPSKMPSKADIQRMRSVYGLDKPLHLAYWQWLKNTTSLNLGTSYSQKKPVAELISDRVWPTLQLSLTSLLLSYLLAVPMGLYATVRSGRADERGLSFALYMLYSFPSFVAALFLQLLFAVKLEGTWLELPLLGNHSNNYEEMGDAAQAWDSFKHMILPVTCFTYGSLAYYCRFVKANMEEVIRQDYIRTARAGPDPPRIPQYPDPVRDPAGTDTARATRRRDHPRGHLQLAGNGPAVFLVDPRSRLPHDHEPDADVLDSDPDRATPGRHPLRLR